MPEGEHCQRQLTEGWPSCRVIVFTLYVSAKVATPHRLAAELPSRGAFITYFAACLSSLRSIRVTINAQ